METQQRILEKLIVKAEEDTAFRKALLSNPCGSLKEALKIELPADFSLVVHEDDARTAHLVLPASPELTDAQLQEAAGGVTICEGSAYRST